MSGGYVLEPQGIANDNVRIQLHSTFELTNSTIPSCLLMVNST